MCPVDKSTKKLIKTETKMKKILKPLSILFASISLLSSGINAQEKTVMVGGAAMYPSKNIVENAVNSKDHSTLVAAVKAAGLVETLQSAGPFTVFAPTNEAFAKLPAGTVETLLKEENKPALTAVLTYHVISGKINSTTLMEMIKKNGGKYTAKTIQGGELSFSMKGKNIVLQDEKGGMSMVTIKDVNQSNGIIHVIDTVVLPKS